MLKAPLMKTILLLAPALLLLAAGQAHSAEAAIGPEAAACRPGSNQPAVLVNVRGFRERTGTIRVQIHGSDANTWLGNKTHLKRIELPVSRPNMPVSVALPGPGRYAVAVRHDQDGDRRFTRRDGGGYSGNPRLSITSLKPPYERSAFRVGNGTTRVDVVMNYLVGLSIRPVA